ncbi:MAG TPA: UDP-N-acetylmuramoyl-tripeptide--D-alanyl-D-alanine ligase, partial [Bryobacteraceae bacterium]|nr:UDP-N-acetylmuramoyl-tripeptide--D-alanyl-D-alanine ligase [Bryobacteraceae bacterium]
MTGSAGKTSTKDIVAALLETKLRTGKTVGNFNNHIGLPLSVLRLPPESQVAVLEYGMNHAGEIRALAGIAQPDIAVVTNVGYAHIEAFDSIEGIAAAKRELVEALPEGGVAILNADDARVRAMSTAHQGRSVLYGLSDDAEIRAEQVDLREEGVRFQCGGVWFDSPVSGRHGVRNLLAGIAVAREFGIGVDQLHGSIETITPGKMRGERTTHGSVKIINDCYNSNPDAVQSML